MLRKPLAALSSVVVALCATPLILGASAQTFSAGSAARVTLVPSLGAIGAQVPLSAGVSAIAPAFPAPTLSVLPAAPVAAPALAAPIAAIVSARTLAPVLQPEAGREANAAAALDLTFDNAHGLRPAALETTVSAAASDSGSPHLDPPSAPGAPLPPPIDKKAQERKETGQLLRAARVPALAGAVVAAIAGGLLGAMGGAVGAVIGSGLGIIGALLGIAVGGYLGLRIGARVGFGKDILGVIIALLIGAAGAVLGGNGGFFGGALLGVMAAKAGGALGAIAGVLALAPIGAIVAGLAAMAVDIIRHPEKYPQISKELKKP